MTSVGSAPEAVSLDIDCLPGLLHDTYCQIFFGLCLQSLACVASWFWLCFSLTSCSFELLVLVWTLSFFVFFQDLFFIELLLNFLGHVWKSFCLPPLRYRISLFWILSKFKFSHCSSTDPHKISLQFTIFISLLMVL